MISVIMPVCNTGCCLKESIDSICNQIYRDWELICVDDGSQDSITLEILDNIEKRDDRIRVIRLSESNGAAFARNTGYREASGEYIHFLDSDDIFLPNMFYSMKSALEDTGADMCVCDFDSFDDNSGEIWERGHLIHREGITDRPFKLSELGERGLLYWWMAPWQILCRKSLIDGNNIYFQNLPCCNDVFFGAMCAQSATYITYPKENSSLIKYRTGRKGAVSSRRHPKFAYEAVNAVLERLKPDEYLKRKQLLVFLVECSMVLFFSYEEMDDSTKEYYKFLKNLIENNIDSWGVKEPDTLRRMNYFINNDYESMWFKKLGLGSEYY